MEDRRGAVLRYRGLEPVDEMCDASTPVQCQSSQQHESFG